MSQTIYERRTIIKKIAISVFSLAALLLLTLSPALALANCDCCTPQSCCGQACCHHHKSDRPPGLSGGAGHPVCPACYQTDLVANRVFEDGGPGLRSVLHEEGLRRRGA